LFQREPLIVDFNDQLSGFVSGGAKMVKNGRFEIPAAASRKSVRQTAGGIAAAQGLIWSFIR
jgi:hypothetical protein